MSLKKVSWSLLSLFVLAAMLLSACGAPATEAPKPAEPAAPAAPAEKQQVEVFSWWTGGGEAAGLDAMIKVFKAKYPDIEFVNAALPVVPGQMPAPCWPPASRLATRPIAGRAMPGRN